MSDETLTSSMTDEELWTRSPAKLVNIVLKQPIKTLLWSKDIQQLKKHIQENLTKIW